jgi:hypothetical protein
MPEPTTAILRRPAGAARPTTAIVIAIPRSPAGGFPIGALLRLKSNDYSYGTDSHEFHLDDAAG